MKTILVSGLTPSTTQDELRQLFEEHGKVMGVDVVEGQEFGYVRMANEGEGRKAIDALDGTMCCGASLTVAAARAGRRREVETSKAVRKTEVVRG